MPLQKGGVGGQLGVAGGFGPIVVDLPNRVQADAVHHAEGAHGHLQHPHPGPVDVRYRGHPIGCQGQGGFEQVAEHGVEDVAEVLLFQQNDRLSDTFGKIAYQFDCLRRCSRMGHDVDDVGEQDVMKMEGQEALRTAGGLGEHGGNQARGVGGEYRALGAQTIELPQNAPLEVGVFGYRFGDDVDLGSGFPRIVGKRDTPEDI